jgi:endonuclease/exonuclease/phosphatase family metal-dependent hydrolase
MAELTVITMNCLGLPLPVPGLRRRLKALGWALAEAGVDVACLQEVGRWGHLQLLRHDEEQWPHAVAASYPYAPKGGLATLARLAVVNPNFHAYRERGRPVSLHTPERFQGKGVLEIETEVDGQRIFVLNTHLAANYNAQWGHTNRYAKVERAQLKELAGVIEHVPDEAIVVLGGDFNVPRGSWLYDEFLAETGMHDPLGTSDQPTFRPLPGMPARAAQALDYILIRAPHHLRVEASSELCFGEPTLLAPSTVGYLSDHLGVRMALRWQKMTPVTRSMGNASVELGMSNDKREARLATEAHTS